MRACQAQWSCSLFRPSRSLFSPAQHRRTLEPPIGEVVKAPSLPSLVGTPSRHRRILRQGPSGASTRPPGALPRLHPHHHSAFVGLGAACVPSPAGPTRPYQGSRISDPADTTRAHTLFPQFGVTSTHSHPASSPSRDTSSGPPGFEVLVDAILPLHPVSGLAWAPYSVNATA